MRDREPFFTDNQSHSLLRGFRLLAFTPVFLAAGCAEEENFQEVAIIAPHDMKDQASKICPQDHDGEVVCDPEWREELVIEQKCSGSKNPVVFNCEPEQLIQGAWVYTLRYEPEKPSCWSFKHLPEGYVLAQNEWSTKPISELCLDSDQAFDASNLLYLLPE